MSLNTQNITRVYNGKIGCMCGCNGKYSTNPAYREEVGTWRGYPVSDEEVSLRSVKIIAKKVLSNPNAIKEGNYFYVEDRVANRIQVVYFKEGSEA
jgi:hypothetical protein